MYKFQDPILDADAFYSDQADMLESFDIWRDKNCKCSCGKIAEFKVYGDLFCNDCANEEFEIGTNVYEYKVDGEQMSEFDFWRHFRYGEDEQWEDYQN